MDDEFRHSESHLLSKEDHDESAQTTLRRHEKSRFPILAISTVFIWTIVVYSVGFASAQPWRAGKWGSFERGFSEERVISMSLKLRRL